MLPSKSHTLLQIIQNNCVLNFSRFIFLQNFKQISWQILPPHQSRRIESSIQVNRQTIVESIVIKASGYINLSIPSGKFQCLFTNGKLQHIFLMPVATFDTSRFFSPMDNLSVITGRDL